MSNQNKKPTLKRQLESGLVATKKPSGADFIPSCDFIIKDREYPQRYVSSVLSTGKENAISGTDLVSMLDLHSKRELTKLVERERRSGVPICASVDNRRPGYYIAEDKREMQLYINSLNRRIREIRITRLCCAKSLKNLQGE